MFFNPNRSKMHQFVFFRIAREAERTIKNHQKCNCEVVNTDYEYIICSLEIHFYRTFAIAEYAD